MHLHTSSAETIDLCTTEGHVKELNYHLNDCAIEFFKLRELCLVVRVNGESLIIMLI